MNHCQRYKGAIVQAYIAPPPLTRVICVDELGPLAVKTYPGEEWKAGPQRATFEPDYGRRGKIWVHGAFEPATGQAELVFSDRRDSVSHLELLEQIVSRFPAERWLIIEDNLSSHTSRQVQMALLAWPEIEVQFIPKYACWLNLIEPWWKQLRSLALKGRRFETLEELTAALQGALAYWNNHKRPYHWKKLPEEQPKIFLGGLRPELNHIAISD
jgi:transposase